MVVDVQNTESWILSTRDQLNVAHVKMAILMVSLPLRSSIQPRGFHDTHFLSSSSIYSNLMSLSLTIPCWIELLSSFPSLVSLQWCYVIFFFVVIHLRSVYSHRQSIWFSYYNWPTTKIEYGSNSGLRANDLNNALLDHFPFHSIVG